MLFTYMHLHNNGALRLHIYSLDGPLCSLVDSDAGILQSQILQRTVVSLSLNSAGVSHTVIFIFRSWCDWMHLK